MCCLERPLHIWYPKAETCIKQNRPRTSMFYLQKIIIAHPLEGAMDILKSIFKILVPIRSALEYSTCFSTAKRVTSRGSFSSRWASMSNISQKLVSCTFFILIYEYSSEPFSRPFFPLFQEKQPKTVFPWTVIYQAGRGKTQTILKICFSEKILRSIWLASSSGSKKIELKKRPSCLACLNFNQTSHSRGYVECTQEPSGLGPKNIIF